MESKKTILLAGATGFIGKELISELSSSFELKILTRHKDKLKPNFYYWNPALNEIDETVFENVTHIINLCGAGIVDKRWTESRKKELLDSRVIPAEFLFSKVNLIPNLEQYITASGINCYDIENSDKVYTEEDQIANDYVSQLVKNWEKGADIFKTKCEVLKVRISFVISEKGGGITKIEKPIKMGFGAIIGSGNQAMPWIHLTDLVRLFHFGIDKKLSGIYHAVSGNSTNKEVTLLLAKKNHKRIWLPKIPSFVLKIILGKLSILVLKGIKASNSKILSKGFEFKFKKIEDCF